MSHMEDQLTMIENYLTDVLLNNAETLRRGEEQLLNQGLRKVLELKLIVGYFKDTE